MTSEICLMNRYAIALAADSATTVTQWATGRNEQRFFKGANKIFQLSGHQPVGMMIFGNADLQRVPWEVIAKDFRSHLGSRSFNALSQYADELFGFIKGHPHLYPAGYHDKTFAREAELVALRYVFDAQKQQAVAQAQDDAARTAAYHAVINEKRQQVDAVALPAHFTQAEVDAALAGHRGALITELESTLTNWQLRPFIDIAALAEFAVHALFKHYAHFLNSTGVVVAGFGDHEYFPSFRHYDCFGFLLGTFVYDQRQDGSVTLENQSSITPFATRSMIDTFAMGVSPDVFTKINEELDTALRQFADTIKAELQVQDITNLDNHINATKAKHSKAWTDAALQSHGWPLRDVIGSLPVEEMASLAETLIMLQSLKEKVTQPTESVSGPIDVAVITKGDGFIWVKRKHYFDPRLNPRFFARQGLRAPNN